VAIVAIKDRFIIPRLIKFLDEPNPSLPFTVKESGKEVHYVRELVRLNHNKNCILCHSISTGGNDFVRAAMPDPRMPLPPAFSPAYYSGVGGDPKRIFVRADVTYLRQDFSLPQAVRGNDETRAVQRFDYCVRLRRLTDSERSDIPIPPTENPQRDAALFALCELTGKALGMHSSDWSEIAAQFDVDSNPRLKKR
jgi:hypothetical protein